MSEEEAIATLKGMKDGYSFRECELCEDNCTTCKCAELVAIETMLDLYSKEKEKNKKLMAKIDVTNWHEKNCYEILKRKYISKDKIKEIVIPTPDNSIPLEIQQSEFYKRILSLLEEK